MLPRRKARAAGEEVMSDSPVAHADHVDAFIDAVEEIAVIGGGRGTPAGQHVQPPPYHMTPSTAKQIKWNIREIRSRLAAEREARANEIKGLRVVANLQSRIMATDIADLRTEVADLQESHAEQLAAIADTVKEDLRFAVALELASARALITQKDEQLAEQKLAFERDFKLHDKMCHQCGGPLTATSQAGMSCEECNRCNCALIEDSHQLTAARAEIEELRHALETIANGGPTTGQATGPMKMYQAQALAKSALAQ